MRFRSIYSENKISEQDTKWNGIPRETTFAIRLILTSRVKRKKEFSKELLNVVAAVCVHKVLMTRGSVAIKGEVLHNATVIEAAASGILITNE